MSSQGNVQLACRLLDALNRADWVGCRSVLSAQAVYEELGTGRRARGGHAAVRLLESWRRALPDLRAELSSVIAQGAHVAQRIVWFGTHSGPLELPGMMVPATGRFIRLEAVLWITVQGVAGREGADQDARVSRVTHCLDPVTLTAQLAPWTAHREKDVVAAERHSAPPHDPVLHANRGVYSSSPPL